MSDKEWDPTNILDVFGDATARRILVLASKRPVSADELADHLDVSEPTVYRRTNELGEYDLLDENVQIDEDGNHYRTFETTFQRVAFEVEDGGYDIDVEMRQSLVDRFEAFWSDLDENSSRVDPEAENRHTTETKHTGTDHG